MFQKMITPSNGESNSKELTEIIIFQYIAGGYRVNHLLRGSNQGMDYVGIGTGSFTYPMMDFQKIAGDLNVPFTFKKNCTFIDINGTETQYSAGDTATISLNTLTSATFLGNFHKL